jgi:hypothetical protein
MSAACAKTPPKPASRLVLGGATSRFLDDGHLKQIAEFPVAAQVQLGIIAQLLDPTVGLAGGT